MWVSRTHYLDLHAKIVELTSQVVAAKAAESAMREQLRIKINDFDWLRMAFNQSQQERQAISLAKGVPLPAVEIAGSQRPVPGEMRVHDNRNLAAIDREQPVQIEGRELAGKNDTLDDEDEDRYAGMTGHFEDVGDDEAKKLGIDHDADGHLVHAK